MPQPRREPWIPPWDLSKEDDRARYAADCTALQLLAQGTCPEHLQKGMLETLVNVLCATYDLEFRPESDRTSAFAAGRRWVGLQLVHMLKTDTAALLGRKTSTPREHG